MSVLNLTAELERLVADIVVRVPELGHIDPQRLLLCVTSTRGGGVHGTYAKIHPLRFAGGATCRTVRRRRRTFTCTMPAVTFQGREMLYLIYFLVPRFLNLPLREKLITIFHELYHIAPECNGDLRRFPGRNYAHGHSTKAYNARMAGLVDAYLELPEAKELSGFLDGDMDALRARHDKVLARKYPVPKLIVSA